MPEPALSVVSQLPECRSGKLKHKADRTNSGMDAHTVMVDRTKIDTRTPFQVCSTAGTHYAHVHTRSARVPYSASGGLCPRGKGAHKYELRMASSLCMSGCRSHISGRYQRQLWHVLTVQDVLDTEVELQIHSILRLQGGRSSIANEQRPVTRGM